MDDQHKDEQHVDAQPATGDRSMMQRALAHARQHPILAIAGAVGVALVGGIEIAGGVAIGAVLARAIGSDRAPTQP